MSTRLTDSFGPTRQSLVALLVTVLLLIHVSRCAGVLECLGGGAWSQALQSCVYEGVVSPRRAASYTLFLPGQLPASSTLKVHVRSFGPRLSASLLLGRARASPDSESRRDDSTQLAFALSASQLSGSAGTVQLYLENYLLFAQHFTALVHVASPATRLHPRDARLLAGLAGSCCGPRAGGDGEDGWCDRLYDAAAALTAAPPPPSPPPPRFGRFWGPSGGAPLSAAATPDFCSWPEVLCSSDGSLLKLSMPGPDSLDCRYSDDDDAAAAVAALAAAPSLAWLDLSATSLGISAAAAAPLLAAPTLSYLELAAAGLTGPLAYWNASGGGNGSAASACAALAPAGRVLLSLSGNALTGRVPDCLARQPDLQELQLGGNDRLTALPADWSRAVSLRLLDVSDCPALAGPLSALPPGLRHLNASWAALGGGLPALPPSLLALDALAAGLEGGVAGADGGAGEGAGGGGGWRGCGNLTYVDLGSNRLRGSMPELPDSLMVLYLDSNALSGSLPDALPSSLLVLNVSANALAGPLPRNGLSALRYLDVSRNGFSGGVPSSLAAASQLIYLNASANDLSGNLTAFATRLRTVTNSLQVLDLSRNSLSGALPASLSYLAVFSLTNALATFPRVLDLSGNQFSGVVPDFVFRLMPLVQLGCRCRVRLSVDPSPGEPPLTCPRGASPLDSSYLSILWVAGYTCADSASGAKYALAQWLTPGFAPAASPAPPATALPPPPPSASAAPAPGGAAQYRLGRWQPDGSGAVAPLLVSYSGVQVMAMAAAPLYGGSGAAKLLPLSLSPKGGLPWPLANVLTVVFASFTAAVVLVLVGYIATRRWLAAARERRLRERRAWRRRLERQRQRAQALSQLAAAETDWRIGVEPTEGELRLDGVLDLAARDGSVAAADEADVEAAAGDAGRADAAPAAAAATGHRRGASVAETEGVAGPGGGGGSGGGSGGGCAVEMATLGSASCAAAGCGTGAAAGDRAAAATQSGGGSAGCSRCHHCKDDNDNAGCCGEGECTAGKETCVGGVGPSRGRGAERSDADPDREEGEEGRGGAMGLVLATADALAFPPPASQASPAAAAAPSSGAALPAAAAGQDAAAAAAPQVADAAAAADATAPDGAPRSADFTRDAAADATAAAANATVEATTATGLAGAATAAMQEEGGMEAEGGAAGQVAAGPPAATEAQCSAAGTSEERPAPPEAAVRSQAPGSARQARGRVGPAPPAEAAATAAAGAEVTAKG